MGNVQVDELQLISGIDIPVAELGLTLHQPRIREIAMLGEQQYFIALSIFRITKENLKIKSDEVNNWMVFQESLKQQIDGVKNPRALLTNFLQLFIPHKVMLGPRSVIIEPDGGELINVEPEQFDILQDVVGAVGGASLLTPGEEQFKPKNKRAAEIAEKMKKARKKLAALQPKAKSQGFLARYVRAVAVATSNSLEDVNNMTLLQLNDVMQTYLAWEAYDLEIRSRLAGAKGDNKLEHWIVRPIHKEDDGVLTQQI